MRSLKAPTILGGKYLLEKISWKEEIIDYTYVD